jgi:uncharacterized protein
MRVVLAGASGSLGHPLLARLRADGCQVVRLVRREPDGPDQVRWSPQRHELTAGVLTRTDVVVNLAGAGVADQRWTARYRDVIRASRVDSTRTLAEAAAALPADQRPRLLVNASAVGFYGDTGETAVDEDAPAGDGFLAQVCQLWEAATGPAEDAGLRVVRLRTGLVLDRDGGLLKRLLLPYRLGLGGPLGSGEQYLPWISQADWLDAVRFCIDHAEIAGPVNLVGPQPVRDKEFSRVLANLLHRPAVIPVPRFALRLALGEFGAEAVASQRVLPGVLTRAGFRFSHGDVESALRATLG